MKKVGKIIDISLEIKNSATALIPREALEKTNLVLGQFVMIGKDNSGRVILGCVESIKPDFGDANGTYREAVRDAMNNDSELDTHYKKQLGHLIYRFKLIGSCHIKSDDSVEFFSDVRNFPPIDGLNVYIPSAKIMTTLMRAAIKTDGGEKSEFHLGDLAYGSDPDNTSAYQGGNAVPVYFNVQNMLRRRTAIVGQSGFGKSNGVKAIIAMVAKVCSRAGQLIIDTNSEYSLDNAQNQGFLDIFHEAKMPDKVLVFTNRNLSPAIAKKYENNLRPLKINAYTEPATVFAIVAEAVRKQIKNDELPKYLVKWVNGAEVEDQNNAWDGVGKLGQVRAMYYAALSLERIMPPKHSLFCETGAYIEEAYVDYLISAQASPDGSNPEAIDSASVVKNDDFIKDQFKIVRKKEAGGYYTNSIDTMIKYGLWLADFVEDSPELRDYRDLVLSKHYRLSSIKKIHISDQEKMSESLSNGVFNALKAGKVVILDLSMESIKVADVVTRHILNHIFTKQMEEFSRPELRKEFNKRDVVVYIEESQNYLGDHDIGHGSIYERIVKEGRKFNIGCTYITQQPSAISQSITSQTENFFALHLSNEKDTTVLHNANDKYDDLICSFIKNESAKGLCYFYSTPWQPFVLPIRLRLFSKKLLEE